VTPATHAEELYRAAGEPKEQWIVPGTPHCGAYFVDRPAYVARVATFFARALGGEMGPLVGQENPCLANAGIFADDPTPDAILQVPHARRNADER